MKKTFNRIISFILVIIMVFSCVPVVMAATTKTAVRKGACGTNANYVLYSDGELIISGTGSVTSNPWLNTRDKIVSVIVEDGITSLCDKAFYARNTIETVCIANTVKTIGASSFGGCYDLISIKLPDALIEIPDYCFQLCENLKEISIPNTVTSIGKYAFNNCQSLSSIDIPESVNSIGNSAFSVCVNVENINIPNSVKEIGERAFSGCSSLKSINLPESLSIVSGSMFWQCEKLAEVVLPKTITVIGSHAFYQCDSLKSIVIPYGVECIDHYTFYSCSKLEEILIPETVTTIESSAFSGCINLKNVALPSSLKNIGSSSFSSCVNLDSVIIPETVTSIGSNAFYNCTKLTIYGYAETTAEKYARDNDINFMLLCRHSYNETIEIEPTCNSVGIKKFACLLCGDCFTEVIPNSEKHSFSLYISDDNAKCLEDGTKTAKCDNCEVTETITDEGSATGHSFTHYLPDNNATCAEDGTKTAKCDNCEVTDTVVDIDSSLEHSYELVNVYKPDCNTDGYGMYVCENCKELYYDFENYKATNHEDKNGDGVCDECAADVEQNSENKKCSCMCHSTGLMKIIYKILRFFWKLFKINKICGCGFSHY